MAIFRDRGAYKLGATSTLRMNSGARDELRKLMMDRAVNPAADAIARRLNDASSWGGYRASRGRQAAFVSALGASRDSDRGRRMLTAANKAADTL